MGDYHKRQKARNGGKEMQRPQRGGEVSVHLMSSRGRFHGDRTWHESEWGRGLLAFGNGHTLEALRGRAGGPSCHTESWQNNGEKSLHNRMIPSTGVRTRNVRVQQGRVVHVKIAFRCFLTFTTIMKHGTFFYYKTQNSGYLFSI